jgi:hypothetical protein
LAGAGCCAAAFKNAKPWQQPPESKPNCINRWPRPKTRGFPIGIDQTLVWIHPIDQQSSRFNTTTNKRNKDVNAAEMRQPYRMKTLAYPIGFAGIN